MVQSVGERPDTQEMVIVHRVFRREFGLAPDIVAAVPAGDVARAQRVAAHLTEMTAMLHHHHTGEDELVWPKLDERAEVPGDLVLRMQAQHERVATLLQHVEELVPAWAAAAADDLRDELAGVLRLVSSVLDEHLAEEEREVLPIIAEHLTAEEWGELGKRGMAAIPKPRMLVVLGHLLEDATPQERAQFISKAPPPARLLFKLVGRRRYEREVAALRAGIPQQRRG